MSEWISVEDRMPEPGELVVVAGYGTFAIGFYVQKLWYITGIEGFESPTHWLPIPDLPENAT